LERIRIQPILEVGDARRISYLVLIWLEGPKWLSNADNWPEDIVPGPNKETEEEAKKIKEVFTTAVEAKDDYAEILESSPNYCMDH